MRLLVIRHGQTSGNKEGRLQGQRNNEPLTPEGVKEVEALIPLLADTPVHALYSSPLTRARETAEIFARVFSMPMVERKELMERDFGTLSGKTWDEIAALGHISLKERDKALCYDYRPFDGENAEGVKTRIILLVNELLEKQREHTVLCVTHGGIVRILYDVLGVEQPAHNKNAALHRFEVHKKVS